MTVFNPLYLVQSRHGIWYFQIQIPPDFRKHHSRTLIRRSLKTRDQNIALSLSKYWYIKVVELNYDLSGLDNNLISTKATSEPLRTLSQCIEEFISEKKGGGEILTRILTSIRTTDPNLCYLPRY